MSSADHSKLGRAASVMGTLRVERRAQVSPRYSVPNGNPLAVYSAQGRLRALACCTVMRPQVGGYTSSVPNFSHLGLFVGAALALLVTPGPAVLYIVTRSVAQGRLVGLLSVLGICTGTLVHVAAAAVGLSALLVSSARAFNVVRFAGAVYLVVLGVQMLARRNASSGEVVLRTGDLRRV